MSQATRIHRVILYPANGETIELAAKEIQGVDYNDGNLQVIQVLPDGTVRRWINLPAMIEHAPPSGLVLPGPGVVPPTPGVQ